MAAPFACTSNPCNRSQTQHTQQQTVCLLLRPAIFPPHHTHMPTVPARCLSVLSCRHALLLLCCCGQYSQPQFVPAGKPSGAVSGGSKGLSSKPQLQQVAPGTLRPTPSQQHLGCFIASCCHHFSTQLCPSGKQQQLAQLRLLHKPARTRAICWQPVQEQQ